MKPKLNQLLFLGNLRISQRCHNGHRNSYRQPFIIKPSTDQLLFQIFTTRHLQQCLGSITISQAVTLSMAATQQRMPRTPSTILLSPHASRRFHHLKNLITIKWCTNSVSHHRQHRWISYLHISVAHQACSFKASQQLVGMATPPINKTHQTSSRWLTRSIALSNIWTITTIATAVLSIVLLRILWKRLWNTEEKISAKESHRERLLRCIDSKCKFLKLHRRRKIIIRSLALRSLRMIWSNFKAPLHRKVHQNQTEIADGPGCPTSNALVALAGPLWWSWRHAKNLVRHPFSHRATIQDHSNHLLTAFSWKEFVRQPWKSLDEMSTATALVNLASLVVVIRASMRAQ